ncbi:MAG: DNA polymerase III subunit alpha [Candidatus Hydrogenedens sp.]|jgi:DNA polymerase-3 subunit alpha|nr:DNA polymerase III subunit alpha [Candidatus Hydrogenedens sp.]
MTSSFVHLHVHSHYSLLDGLTKPAELVKRCADYDMPACALTDHGSLFGLLEFQKAAVEAGIKPVLGCEMYISPTSRTDKSARSSREASNHLLLLCENETGYHNLCRLSSLAYLEGWHYRPRIDLEALEEYKEGLILSTACLQGRVPSLLLADRQEEAAAALDTYVGIFGKDHVYIEMMNHGMPEEEKINPGLWDMAQHYGLPVIATNDSHYLDESDWEAHDVLLCLQTKKLLEDESRMRFPNHDFYFRSAEEMAGRFSRWPEAISNTGLLAERCNATIPTGLRLIPSYPVPEGQSKADYLCERVYEGLHQRFGGELTEAIRQRADYELDVISRMQFVDYFLVVWDLVHYARNAGIPIGPGRGSGAGCLVAYALGITNLDPLRYNLLFERFLNPERQSMPDFDIDFCITRREDIIEYSRSKYGSDCVCQIVTFGRMLARNVVHNVARTLGMSPAESRRIATMIPNELKITLASALEKEPDLKRAVEEDPDVGRLWKLATRLEGTINNFGTHAAGVVICDHPLTDHIGLFKAAGSDTVVTQVEMKGVDAIGLLKMDILGLRTLTMIDMVVQLVKKNHQITVDLDRLDIEDKKTYALLRSGATLGIFQLESSGMRELAKRIGLQSLEEMSALVALYRPGPMQLIESYIQNKRAPEKIVYDPPELKDLLKETYGIPVYQEQVMQMTQICGGFSLGNADTVRRAMSKKDQKLLKEQEALFVEGCARNGYNKGMARELWARIETFSGYGFNKSHSIAYAFVAYQTAYLKANFPVEFMCALLTTESGDPKKTALYVAECHRMGISVLPPDVNASEVSFSVEGKAIRFGLGAIKNLGEAPCNAIVQERNENGPFRDIFDFCDRLIDKSVNGRAIDSLNKAGAFSSTDWNRRQVSEVMEEALQIAQSQLRERESGQTSLFDLAPDDSSFKVYPDKPESNEWPAEELLAFEKEMLGLYVSSHPLRSQEDLVKRFTTLDLNDLEDKREGEEILLTGIITEVKKIYSKKGDAMAFLTLESLQGPCEMIVFSRVYEEKKDLLLEDNIVTCRMRMNFRDGKPSLIVENVVLLEEAERLLATALHIRLSRDKQEAATLHRLACILNTSGGPCDVYLHCDHPEQGEVVIHTLDLCRVTVTSALESQIEELLGMDTVFVSAGMGLPSHAPPRIIVDDTPRYRRRRAAGN